MSTSKVWLITGATSGIGLELAKAAMAAGHKVIATYRDASKTPDTIVELEKLGTTWVQLDVGATDVETKIQDTVVKFGHIDVLVNNAGYALSGSIEDISVEHAKELFAVNLFGPLRTVQALLPSMRARQSGTIVNVGSSNGIRASPGLGLYSASKFALEGLTEGLQAELSSFGIRVLLVEPGMVATRIADPNGAGVIIPSSDTYKGTAADLTMQGILQAYAAGRGASAEKTALRIVEAVDGTGLLEGKEVALRLPLGSDAVGYVEAKGREYLTLAEELKAVSGSI
ncbi:uncharacterized protein JN550_007693 [Neoarthrinium moseri]|uniref:uncharacterized protein n=1 Tax=Neoarthrinium moseri TaxID=1658444 RepID=UPI001FDE7417|nr:uncharacterized protein JN550_007693 [Neoarthrinium moseri]KAI1866305.1 hypothetical protein JN550_007693 [Neoarthrinium moseri]